MQSRRHERVRELLIRTLGEVVRREFPVQDTGVVTITDVGLSGDLHSATVYVSIYGSEEQNQKGLKLLVKQRKRLQMLLSQAVILKNTPKLVFKRDVSLERGDRILHIMDDLERSHPTE